MDPILQEYYLQCIAPGSELCREGLIVVIWPKQVVTIN